MYLYTEKKSTAILNQKRLSSRVYPTQTKTGMFQCTKGTWKYATTNAYTTKRYKQNEKRRPQTEPQSMPLPKYIPRKLEYTTKGIKK